MSARILAAMSNPPPLLAAPARYFVDTLPAAILAHEGDAAAAPIGKVEQQRHGSGADDASPRTAI